MSAKVIPQLWLNVPLEEVILRIVGGGTPSKSKPEYYQGNIPWMSVKDMNKYVLVDTVDHISLEAVENSSTNVIPAGTPIIATRMSLGKIVVSNFDSAINQDLKALFLSSEIHRDYLVYWYRSVARSIEQMGTGTTVKGIRLEVLKSLKFALPPFAEQKVIADKLDTLLAQVENSQARLERIPQILKRFRQSVLSAAVSGRLTKELKLGALLDNWQDGVLGDFASVSHRFAFPSKDFSEEGSGIVLTPGNFSADGQLDFVNKRVVRTSEFDAKWVLNEGDLVIVMTDLSQKKLILGVSSFIDGNYVYLHNQRIGLVKEKSPNMNRSYLKILLNNPSFKKAIDDSASGTLIQHTSPKKIASVAVSVPPSEEQTEIVRRVDQLFAHADRIEQQVNQALARVNNLTQSILAKAFRGELTEQWRKDNPELISGEHSASALLERIKAERAAKAPAKRRKRSA